MNQSTKQIIGASIATIIPVSVVMAVLRLFIHKDWLTFPLEIIFIAGIVLVVVWLLLALWFWIYDSIVNN